MPPDLQTKLDLLRKKGAKKSGLSDLLEKRWHEAQDERDRERVKKTIVSLSEPSRPGIWIMAVALLPFVVWGAHMLSQYYQSAQVDAGERAVAEIKRLDRGSCWFTPERSECVQLTLLVHPIQGPSFSTQLSHEVPRRWLARVQSGSLVYVALDGDGVDKVRLDENALAEPPPEKR